MLKNQRSIVLSTLFTRPKNTTLYRLIAIAALGISVSISGCKTTEDKTPRKPHVNVQEVVSPNSINKAKHVLAKYLASDNKILSEYVDYPFIGKNNIVVLEKEKEFYGTSTLFTNTYDVETIAVDYLYYTQYGGAELKPINPSINSFRSLKSALAQRLASFGVLDERDNGYYVIELISNVGDIRTRVLLQDIKTHKIIGEF